MATVTTGPYHIQCPLHGNGVANSSNYPIINADFEITFSRDDGSSTVTWQISNNTWSGTSSGNGHYAFQFWAEPTINDQTPPEYGPYIMSKTSTSWTTHWWNEVSLFNPSATFTSTSNVATLKLWVWSECTNSSGSCYGHGWRQVYAIDLVIPTYETKYAVTYNGNGGSPVPGDQEKSSLGPMQISPIRPYKYVTINYYNNPTQSDSASIDFNGWLCSADSQIYQPNGSYGINQACTMTAQWGSAHFTPPAMPSATYTVTFNYMGGAGIPASTPLQRAKLGYSTNSAATTADYAPGTSYTTATDLNLYPIFGSATVVYNNLPQTTKDGYAFRGWFKDSACTQKITSDYTISDNTTIYAGWTPLPVHKRLPNGTWNNMGPTVYKRLSNGTWSNEAHVYKYISGEWVDLSQ